MAVSELERILGQYAAAWSARDVQQVLSFFTDDCVYEDIALGRVNRGKEELKAFLSETFAAFPDFTIEPKTPFMGGNWVGLEWVMSGTHKGDIPGLPATGKSFSIRGVSIVEMAGDKIKNSRDYWDMATFLRQIGVMPGG